MLFDCFNTQRDLNSRLKNKFFHLKVPAVVLLIARTARGAPRQRAFQERERQGAAAQGVTEMGDKLRPLEMREITEMCAEMMGKLFILTLVQLRGHSLIT